MRRVGGDVTGGTLNAHKLPDVPNALEGMRVRAGGRHLARPVLFVESEQMWVADFTGIGVAGESMKMTGDPSADHFQLPPVQGDDDRPLLLISQDLSSFQRGCHSRQPFFIPKSHIKGRAFGIVFVKPFRRNVGRGEDFDMVGIASLLVLT